MHTGMGAAGCGCWHESAPVWLLQQFSLCRRHGTPSFEKGDRRSNVPPKGSEGRACLGVDLRDGAPVVLLVHCKHENVFFQRILNQQSRCSDACQATCALRAWAAMLACARCVAALAAGTTWGALERVRPGVP